MNEIFCNNRGPIREQEGSHPLPAMKSSFLLIPLLLPSALSAQTITVFTNRAAFEAAIGGSFYVDDFSLAPPLLGVTTTVGSLDGAKWFDLVNNPATPTTVWDTSFGSTAWGGTWDPTPAGPGGGVAFEVDFGGGNIVTVPGIVAGNSPANVFFGFTASSPFLSVRVKAAGATQETHTLDDMTFQGPAGAFGILNFIQPGAGAWDTAAHWDAATTPGLLARVTIAPTGGTTASGPTVATTVQSLTLGSATSASRLDLQNGVTLTVNAGALVRTGSTLGGAGRLIGPVAMAAGSTLTVADGLTLQAGAATAVGFSTTGTITVGTGTLILEDTGATPLGTLTTVAGGTLTALGGTAQIGSGDTLRGHGLLTGAFELLSGGTLRAQNGSLQVEQLNAVAGTATVDDGRMLSIGGTNALAFATVSVGTGGTLSTTGRLQLLGSATLGAGATISGTSGLDIAGPISHAGSQIFNAGSADLTVFDISFTPDAADTLTGGRLVLEGRSSALLFSSDAVLGTAGNQILLKGGQLFPQANFTVPSTRNIEVTAQNGSIIALAGRNVTLEGNISGAGRFLVTGSGNGTVRLTGNNTQAGGTDIAGATLEISSDANLGGPNGVLLIGRENGFTDIPGKLRALGNLNIPATRSTTFRLTTVDTNGFNVTFNQPVSGHDLTKQGGGVLRFNTANPFNSGVNSIDIEEGTIRLGINEALGLPRVTLFDTTLDLNGFAQTLASLSGTGAVQLGNGGTLTFAGGSTLDAVISGTGSVNFGKAGSGADAYRVLGENTFTGTVTITQGNRVTMKTTAAFGAAGNSVLLDDGGIEADSQASEPVVISTAFPMTIGAGGAVFGANGQSLIIEALLAGNVPIGVRGGDDGYEVRFAHAANTFTSNLTIGSNDFGSGVLGIVADGSLGNAANVITLGYRFFDGESTRTGTGTLRAFADIVFPASRALRLNGDENQGDGGIFDTNGFNITVTAPISQVTVATPLRKTGAGTLTLNGANTYTGTTEVAAGTLAVNGSCIGETQVQSSGTLSGTGTVGKVSVFSGGALAPGSSPGTLHTGDVTFESGSTFALEFASPALGDQLAVTGSVTINAAEIAPIAGYTITGPDTFAVIANDGTDPVVISDFFTSGGIPLTEGASFVSGGATWKISYTGGDGNDVTLTATPAATAQGLTLVSASISDPAGGGSGKRLQGSVTGQPGAAVRLQRSTDLFNWTALSTFSLDGLGAASFDVTDAPAADRTFYRLITP